VGELLVWVHTHAASFSSLGRPVSLTKQTTKL
jgi:hypothetical protein